MLRSFGRESGHTPATERLRREIARELDMDLRRTYSSSRRPWDDASDASDEFPGVHATAMRSPGNHSVLLATPRGLSPPRRMHRRPALSREESERINFSTLGTWDAPKESTLHWRHPQPSSRHSSGETKVDDPGTDPTAEFVWADRQLDALVKCVTTMEQELASVRTTFAPNADLARLRERVDALEAALEVERTRIAAIHKQMELERETPAPAPAPAPATAPTLASAPASAPASAAAPAPDHGIVSALAEQLAALATRERAPRVERPAPRPPTPPPTAQPRATIHNLYDELARVSTAVEQLQRDAHAAAEPLPPTPPLEPADISWVPDDQVPIQERYERICRTVADALGLANAQRASPANTRRRTRKDQIRSTLRQREELDAASGALLQRLEAAPFPVSLSAHELQVLEHLFEEHRAEFIHQRRLYSELADELKRMEPSMDRTKRRILAEHVHESIDTLEAEATRVNDLHAHLKRYGRAP